VVPPPLKPEKPAPKTEPSKRPIATRGERPSARDRIDKRIEKAEKDHLKGKKPAEVQSKPSPQAAMHPIIRPAPNASHYDPMRIVREGRALARKHMKKPRLAVLSLAGLRADGVMNVSRHGCAASAIFSTDDRNKGDVCFVSASALNEQEILTTQSMDPCSYMPVRAPKCSVKEVLQRAREQAPLDETDLLNLVYMKMQGKPSWLFSQKSNSAVIADDC
jgi:hypothetical protein